MIIRKTKTERLKKMMEQLVESQCGINNLSPGGVARSFLEIMNEELEVSYTYLETYIPMAFLSTSQGRYIDLLGALVNCERNPNESDQNYKYRIHNQVYSVAGANYTSIYLACLSVEGVRDISIVPYVYGIGTFVVYVITDEPETPDAILKAVQEAIDNTKAFGIIGVAEKPTVKRMNIGFKLYFDNSASSNDILTATRTAKDKIKNNIDNTQIGSAIYLNNLLDGVVQTSGKIINVEITHLSLDGKYVYSKYIKLKTNEKIYAGTVSNN